MITAWSDKSPGHLPEREIRAVALALRSKLRPGVALEHYKVDVDCLLVDYKPKDYRPVVTRYLGAKRTRGRPAGHLGAQTNALLAALRAIAPDAFGRRVYTLASLGEKRRTVQYRLNALRKAGLIATGQIDGNGKPYAILTEPPAGGAQVYSRAVDEPVLPAATPETDPPLPMERQSTRRQSVFLQIACGKLRPRPHCPPRSPRRLTNCRASA